MTTENKPRNLADPFVIFSDPREGDRFEFAGKERQITCRKGEWIIVDSNARRCSNNFWRTLASHCYLNITNIRPVPNPEPAKAMIWQCRCGATLKDEGKACWPWEYDSTENLLRHWHGDEWRMAIFIPDPTPSREDSSAGEAKPEATTVHSESRKDESGVQRSKSEERPPAVRVFKSIHEDVLTRWVFGRKELPEWWHDDKPCFNLKINCTAEQMALYAEWIELPPAEAEKWCEEHPLQKPPLRPGFSQFLDLDKINVGDRFEYDNCGTWEERVVGLYYGRFHAWDEKKRCYDGSLDNCNPQYIRNYRTIPSPIPATHPFPVGNTEPWLKEYEVELQAIYARLDSIRKNGMTIPSPDSPGKSDLNVVKDTIWTCKCGRDEHFYRDGKWYTSKLTPTQEKPCQTQKPSSSSAASQLLLSASPSLAPSSNSTSGSNAPADDAWAKEKAEIAITKARYDNGGKTFTSERARALMKREIAAALIEAEKRGSELTNIELDAALARVKELEAENNQLESKANTAMRDRDLLEVANDEISRMNRELNHANNGLAHQCNQLAAENADLRETIQFAMEFMPSEHWMHQVGEYEHEHRNDCPCKDTGVMPADVVRESLKTPSPLVADFLNCREAIEVLRKSEIEELPCFWRFENYGLHSTNQKNNVTGEPFDGWFQDPLAAILAGKGKV